MKIPIRTYAGLYVLAAAMFLVIDLVWIGTVADNFYSRQLQGLLKPQVNWWAALLFYVIYIAGLMIFAVIPGINVNSSLVAATRGAALGAVAYGAFDLTNLALIRDWPVAVAAVDMAWGTLLTASVAASTSWFGVRFAGKALSRSMKGSAHGHHHDR